MSRTPLSRMLAERDSKPDALGAFRFARRRFLAGARVEMQELAGELGVSRATVFRWVGSRDDLLVEIIWSIAEPTFRHAVEGTVGLSGGRRIAAVMGGFAEAVIASPPFMEFVQREPERALRLLTSKATWKVLAADMPISLVVPDPLKDGTENYEAIANRDNGAPLGRELEIADLLRFIKQNGIRNIVWLTADVHYTAAHYYDPGKAQFQDFDPFWEFVSGPLNAGTYGPNELDATFGPQLKFQKAPPKGQAGLSPASEMQFFGHVKIDAATETMTVTLKDLKNCDLYAVDIDPVSFF